MNHAAELLTAITLAVSGWTLLNVIALKEQVARVQQKVDDLPCSQKKSCPAV